MSLPTNEEASIMPLQHIFIIPTDVTLEPESDSLEFKPDYVKRDIDYEVVADAHSLSEAQIARKVEQYQKLLRAKRASRSTIDKRLCPRQWNQLIEAALLRTDLTASELLKGIAAMIGQSDKWVEAVSRRPLYDHEHSVIKEIFETANLPSHAIRLLKITKQLDIDALLRCKKISTVLNTLMNQVRTAMEIATLQVQLAEQQEKLKLADTPEYRKQRAKELVAQGMTHKQVAEQLHTTTKSIQNWIKD